MNYIQSFDEYSINESKVSGIWASIQNKILKDHKINFYFTTTFGLALTVFYPLVGQFVKHLSVEQGLTTTDIVLLSLAAIAVISKESKDEIGKLLLTIKEKGLESTFDKIKSYINSIFKIFKVITSKLGISISTIIDMFAYTTLCIPFVLTLQDIINAHGFMDLLKAFETDITGKSLALIIGSLSLSAKHIFAYFINKLKSKLKWRTSDVEKIDELEQEVKESISYEITNEGVKSDLVKLGLVGSLLIGSPDIKSQKLDKPIDKFENIYNMSITNLYDNIQTLSDMRKKQETGDPKLDSILNDIKSNLKNADGKAYQRLFNQLSKHMEEKYGYKIEPKDMDNMDEEIPHGLSLFAIIGWMGAICLAVCGLPQAWESYKARNSEGISWSMLLLWGFGELLTFIYVFEQMNVPLITNIATNILAVSIMIWFKLFPEQKRKIRAKRDIKRATKSASKSK